MNCWKTYNLSRDIGFHRIILIAVLTMLLTFVSIYVAMSSFFPNVQLQDDGLIFFFIGLVLIVPVHKLLHALPAWLLFKRARMLIEWRYRVLPIVEVKFPKSMSRNLSMIALVSPSIWITIPLIIGCISFPTHIHYFALLAAFNIGISVTDFIYLILFFKAPRKCFIENFDGGVDILIKRQ